MVDGTTMDLALELSVEAGARRGATREELTERTGYVPFGSEGALPKSNGEVGRGPSLLPRQLAEKGPELGRRVVGSRPHDGPLPRLTARSAQFRVDAAI